VTNLKTDTQLRLANLNSVTKQLKEGLSALKKKQSEIKNNQTFIQFKIDLGFKIQATKIQNNSDRIDKLEHLGNQTSVTEQLVKELSALKSKQSSIKTELIATKTDMRSLSKNTDARLDELDKNQKDISNDQQLMGKSLTALQNALQTSTRTIDALKNVQSTLVADNEAISKMQTSLLVNTGSIDKRISKLQVQVAGCTDCKANQGTLRSLTSEIATVKNQIKDNSDDIEKLKKNKDNGCMLTKKGHKCVFPFREKGKHSKTYTKCTTDYNEGIPWCATKVDHKGEMKKDDWGECDRAC